MVSRQAIKAELADLDAAESAAILQQAGFGLAELSHQVNLEILDGSEVSASEKGAVENAVESVDSPSRSMSHLGWDFAEDCATPSVAAPTTLDSEKSDSDIEMVVYPKQPIQNPPVPLTPFSCGTLGGNMGLDYSSER